MRIAKNSLLTAKQTPRKIDQLITTGHSNIYNVSSSSYQALCFELHRKCNPNTLAVRTNNCFEFEPLFPFVKPQKSKNRSSLRPSVDVDICVILCSRKTLDTQINSNLAFDVHQRTDLPCFAWQKILENIFHNQTKIGPYKRKSLSHHRHEPLTQFENYRPYKLPTAVIAKSKVTLLQYCTFRNY